MVIDCSLSLGNGLPKDRALKRLDRLVYSEIEPQQGRKKKMNFQHVENLLIRIRGQAVNIKTVSGGVYEGTITDVTNDYVTLRMKGPGTNDDQVVVLLHSIESVVLAARA
jgi:hypothetical protein